MNITFWYECGISGGTDWFLIDLINDWPDANDSFTLFVNKDHEGVEVLRNHLPSSVNLKLYSRLNLANWNKRNRRKFYSLFGRKVGHGIKRIINFLALAGYIPIQTVRIWQILKKSKPDCLVINNGGYPGGLTVPLVLFTARLLKIRRRWMIVHNFPIKFTTRRLLDNQCRKKLTGLITVSHAVKEDLADEGITGKDRLHVIYNGIGFRMSSGKVIFQRQPNHRYIGIVGSLEMRKGHATLFKAFSALKDEYRNVRLVVVGSDVNGYRSELINLAEKLGIGDKISWLGYTPNVLDVMKQLDVLVVPSVTFESFGRVIVEAMACKVPVIASRLGGIPEIIRHKENGLLFTPGSSKDLAECLKLLLTNRSLCRKFSSEGYKTFINNFQADVMAKHYYNLLHRNS